MSINLITYLRQLIKKIHYIIIILIVLVSLQFVYNNNRVDKSNLTLKINLYPIKVMYWTQSNTTGLNGSIDNQLLNLLYEIEKSVKMNEEHSSLIGTTCTVKAIILSCETQEIDDKDIATAKIYLKKTINNKLNNFFEKEFFFIDKKIASLKSSLMRLNKNQKKMAEGRVQGEISFVMEKNYLAQLEAETKIFDLYFLQESFQTVKSLLLLTDQNIEIKKASRYNNYPITILFGFLTGMLIIFFGMIEQKPED